MKKLRVAIFTESYPPNISGVAVFASELAEGLLRAGHEVVVVAPSPKGKPYHEMVDGVLVYRLRSIPNPLRKKFRLVNAQDLPVRRMLQAFKPDVIHVQDPGGCAGAGQRYALRYKVPLVGTYHFSLQFVSAYIPLNKILPPQLKSLVKVFCNDFYNKCDIVTCPTQIVKKDLVKQGVTQPVVVISNGVNTDGTSQVKPRTVEQYAFPTLLFIGRIDEDKNIPMLLKAIPYVLAEHPARFVLVGDGNQRRTYKQWVKRHGLEEYIEFTGSFPYGSEKLAEVYRNAQISVTPSLIETQSVATMEAMVAGLPVVAPRAGALPELVEHEKTGLLVDIAAPQPFARAILQLLRDPEKSIQYGMNALVAIQKHSRDKTIASFIELYTQVSEKTA